MVDARLRDSIRFRITTIATVLAGLLLAGAAVALVGLQQGQLTSNLDNSLEQRADTYEATIAAEDDTLALSRTNDDDRAIQLVDADGEVVLATPNIDGHPPLGPDLAPDRWQTIVETDLPLLEDDAYRILSRTIPTESGPATLHVAQNIDDLTDAIRALAIALAIAVPAVVILLAVLTWWLVGRTLQPVEHIRAEVADISGADLGRRVPVSAQGDEIARLASTMNEMLDRLERSSSRQQRFVADASHELRTPLTRIRTEVEVDLSRPEGADPEATNRTILEEIDGLQSLLDDLLFLARFDERRSPRTPRPVDLDDVVLSEVADLRNRTDARIDTSGVQAGHLVGDARELARVVRNLLANAIRHAASETRIEVDELDGMVRLVVTDDGAGVPAEARDRIFERFGRADDARTRDHGGAGLGLAIVRDIVGRHGGTITYADAPGGGAQFTVTLPRQPRS